MYKVDSASMQAWMSQAASEDESTNLANMLSKIATFKTKQRREVTQVYPLPSLFFRKLHILNLIKREE